MVSTWELPSNIWKNFWRFVDIRLLQALRDQTSQEAHSDKINFGTYELFFRTYQWSNDAFEHLAHRFSFHRFSFMVLLGYHHWRLLCIYSCHIATNGHTSGHSQQWSPLWTCRHLTQYLQPHGNFISYYEMMGEGGVGSGRSHSAIFGLVLL